MLMGGEPGIGKSRLTNELFAAVDEQASVLLGHCLPYGEGITYWPVVEVVKQLGVAGALSDETARHALRVVLGEVDVTAATPDQIAWAFRKLLEANAVVGSANSLPNGRASASTLSRS